MADLRTVAALISEFWEHNTPQSADKIYETAINRV